jgi:hypothetical protein
MRSWYLISMNTGNELYFPLDYQLSHDRGDIEGVHACHLPQDQGSELNSKKIRINENSSFQYFMI